MTVTETATAQSIAGVKGEERHDDLTVAERRALRRRSIRLLVSLQAPMRRRLVLTVVVVLVATGVQVLGPAVVAWGIDTGIPALRRGEVAPVVVAVVLYLVAGVLAGTTIAAYTIQTARISQAWPFPGTTEA